MLHHKSLRPSADAFRKSGWLPRSKEAYDTYMKALLEKLHATATPAHSLLSPVRDFKDFIESDITVYGEFARMFDDVAESPKNYHELINILNEIFREAPSYGDYGPPVYMVMTQIMNSEGGFSAFTRETLNVHFKRMFQMWSLYLVSKDSVSVLHPNPNGWLSAVAKDAMTKAYPGRTFEEVFLCDPSADHHGYTSYEDFFTRRLRDPETDRPTGNLTDNSIISAACESISYAYKENVREMDHLFIKGDTYSLRHLLAGHFVDKFIGGTVLQGFLPITGYHRWHAPVNGTVRKIVDVPGTYFAQSPYMIGQPTDDPNILPPYLQSLPYLANTAARQLIFIEPDDSRIGLVCFIAIGMAEISTCQATVYERQHVVRGNELGMFHFGGSSSALVFRKDSMMLIDDKYKLPEEALKINEPIGAVPRETPANPRATGSLLQRYLGYRG